MTLRSPIGLLVAALALALAGAAAFGLWHIVVGGLVRGNVRAGEFGIVLASVAGGLLALLWLAVRRHHRAA